VPAPTKTKKPGRPKLAKGERQGWNIAYSGYAGRTARNRGDGKSQRTDGFRMDTNHIECRYPRVRISN
jgi:hypothetical protein